MQQAIIPRLTEEQAAIISAFTGILCGSFSSFQGYAEAKLGRPVWTHEFGDKMLTLALKEASKADFLAICAKDPAQ